MSSAQVSCPMVLPKQPNQVSGGSPGVVIDQLTKRHRFHLLFRPQRVAMMSRYASRLLDWKRDPLSQVVAKSIPLRPAAYAYSVQELQYRRK